MIGKDRGKWPSQRNPLNRECEMFQRGAPLNSRLVNEVQTTKLQETERSKPLAQVKWP